MAFPLQRGVSPKLALALLVTARLISAAINIIHDCDETYNFWEPLHYLFYGTGMQTWEYSAGFALRPYIYLLIHALVGGPVALVVGKGAGGCAAAPVKPGRPYSRPLSSKCQNALMCALCSQGRCVLCHQGGSGSSIRVHRVAALQVRNLLHCPLDELLPLDCVIAKSWRHVLKPTQCLALHTLSCRAVQRRYSVVMANSFLALLCITTGMFVSATGFLPSSFTMYAVTAAAAGVLEGKQYYVIIIAAIGEFGLRCCCL